MFTSISKFSTKGKEGHSIACKLEGVLLISTTTFPYFMLIAFEAGGAIRALILLLMSPIVSLLEWFCHEKLALQLMVFVCMLGLKADDVSAVAKSVLPRFYLDDIRASAFKVFCTCGGTKYVVTTMPRIMAEPFLKDYLNVNCVIGAELRFIGGYCLGLVVKPEAAGFSQSKTVMAVGQSDTESIDIGLGTELDDHLIMLSCQERYIVPADEEVSQLSRDDYLKPLIFHDGRLVPRPTPLNSLVVFLWIPLGIVIAILRIQIGLLLPYKLQALAAAATGVKSWTKLPPNPNTCALHSRSRCVSCDPGTYVYTLYACSHRTLIDPLVIAAALERPVTAVTYSISKISEFLAPIRTVRLSRDRDTDEKVMQEILKQGDLVVCPEGTTCREPYLLRFSPLFAEVADVIVPVALETKSSMFYGTTVRGYKWLDPFFFLMNPNPEYRIQFLEKMSGVRATGKSSSDVADLVQKTIGNALGFECTNLTRKDKYTMLAGNDGKVKGGKHS